MFGNKFSSDVVTKLWDPSIQKVGINTGENAGMFQSADEGIPSIA